MGKTSVSWKITWHVFHGEICMINTAWEEEVGLTFISLRPHCQGKRGWVTSFEDLDASLETETAEEEAAFL